MIRTISLGLLLSFSVFAQEPQAEKARGLLKTALGARNPDTRIKAIQAMSIIGPRPEVLMSLEEAFNVDKDVPTKIAVVDCLSSFKDQAAVPLLEKALQSETPEVVLAAGRVLFNMKRDSGKDVLYAILIGEEKAASGFITTQKRDYLRLMKTPVKLMMTAATMAPVPYLGAGLSSAQAIMSDPAGSARAGVLLMLQDDPDPAIQKAIRAAIGDKEWSVRAAAIHALAFRNDVSLKTQIGELMDDKNEKVRLRAAAAFLRLDALK